MKIHVKSVKVQNLECSITILNGEIWKICINKEMSMTEKLNWT